MRLRSSMLLLLLAATNGNAQIKPNGKWRQIESRHFRVIYEAGLDSLARRAAEQGERTHARLSAELIAAPPGKIDLILTNRTDITNGYATPFPSNRVAIFVRPPVEDLSLQQYNDWIELLVTHELTHTFQMDRAGWPGRAVRKVFGRVPFTWPIFPIVDQPSWNHEGLATMIESQHTGAGRVVGSFHEMIVRTGIVEGRFDPIDRVSGETPIWPGGARAYIYGSLFMDYIARRYGNAAHRELIEKTAGSLLPPSWRLDAIARKATGETYTNLYKDWKADLERTYVALGDSLTAQGLTRPEQLTTTGRSAYNPRVSPNGRFLAFAEENGRDYIATRIIDLQNNTSRRIRRNGLAPSSWTSDSSFITAQYEFDNPYEIYSDLYLFTNRGAVRLSKGLRAEDPDVSRAGRLVFVQNTNGTNRLVISDLKLQSIKQLAASPDVQWTQPRWSPRGDWIAVQRWTRANGHEIAVLDSTGAVQRTINTTGIDATPAWSPDGEWMVFSSDRTGISNLYAQRGDELRQITNLLGGAYYPDVSADGEWIYFSGYHADGFHIERIPFDPTTWRTPQPAASPSAARPDTVRRAARTPAPAQAPMTLSAPRRYNAWNSGRPHYWLPNVYGDSLIGTFLGFSTSGEDDIGRHAYRAAIAFAPDSSRVAGSLHYLFAGLGVPVMQLSVSRDYANNGLWIIRDAAGAVRDTVRSYKREDNVGITAIVPLPRWRSNASLLLGIEGARFVRTLPTASFKDPQDKLIGVIAGVSYANAIVPALAISPEDGIRASVFARRRRELDALPGSDASYSEVRGYGSVYKGISAFGFAHHAFAVRGSGLVRTKIGPGPTDVGGVLEFLPVRGFSSGRRIGFRAWSASAEYRLPLALVGRGYRVRPLFLDRLWAAAFFDAGNASCNAAQKATYLVCAGNAARPAATLMSAGFEVRARASVLTFIGLPFRVGVAYPIRGEGSKTAEYFFSLSSGF